MKIVAISDTHGYLPAKMPEGDILLIAGDFTPVIDHSAGFQKMWLDGNFRYWLKNLPYKHIVVTPGNHDWIFQNSPETIKALKLPCHILVDEEVTLEGLRIYGTPWQPTFYNWAYNLDEPELKEKWALIPQGTDILVLHGPPHGYGDKSFDYDEYGVATPVNTGSPSLLEKIKEVKPKLTVYGHIHSGYGNYEVDGIQLANVSYVNEKYIPTNAPMVFDI